MKKLLSKSWSNTFIQGGVILTVSNFFVGFLNYLFNIFTARALGPAGYGDIAALFSYLVTFSIPIGVLGNAIILKIGKQSDPDAYMSGLNTWIKSKLKRWWWIIALSFILIPFVPALTNLTPLVGYILIPYILLSYISSFYDATYQALHLFLLFMIFNVVAGVLKFTGSVSALWVLPDVQVVLAFLLLSMIVKIILNRLALANHLKSKTPVVLQKRIIHLLTDKELIFTALSSASIVVLSNVDVMFAKRVLSAEEAGLYSAWSLFAKIMLYVLGPIISISFIYFSSKKNEKYHRVYFIGLVLFFFLAGIANYIAYSLYPNLFIDLIFGKKFYQLLPYMNWAAIFGFLYMMIMFLNSYFLSQKKRSSLILAATVPFYILGLFFFGKTLGDIMRVNIIFSAGVVFLYFIPFVWGRVKMLME